MNVISPSAYSNYFLNNYESSKSLGNKESIENCHSVPDPYSDLRTPEIKELSYLDLESALQKTDSPAEKKEVESEKRVVLNNLEKEIKTLSREYNIFDSQVKRKNFELDDLEEKNAELYKIVYEDFCDFFKEMDGFEALDEKSNRILVKIKNEIMIGFSRYSCLRELKKEISEYLRDLKRSGNKEIVERIDCLIKDFYESKFRREELIYFSSEIKSRESFIDNIERNLYRIDGRIKMIKLELLS